MTPDVAAPLADDADPDALTAQLRALEAENARLHARVADATASSRPRGRVWRAFVSALCIVVASILVPVSVVGAWSRAELVDEDRFVSTFAPLADDPQVQALLINETTQAIEAKLDLRAITDDLFDGLEGILPPRSRIAIGLLRAPAANALSGLVDSTVTRLVQSDAFSAVWAGALRASHRSLVAASTGETPRGGVTISDAGEVGINLGPIVERVKERLVEQGLGFAAAIPVVNKTIVVAQSGALVTVAVVYNIAVAVGWWLPLVALALFAVGVAVARRRRIALVGSGVGFALGGLSLVVGLGIGGTVLALSAGSLGVPSAALSAIYSQIVGAMEHTAWIVALVGVIVALFGWAFGASRAAVGIRSGVGSVNDAVRDGLATRGVDTGTFGSWMYGRRVLVRVLISALLVCWLLFLRPLTVSDVVLVLLVGLIVWWLAELVQRRPVVAATIESAAPATIDDPPTAADPAVTPAPRKPRSPRKPRAAD